MAAGPARQPLGQPRPRTWWAPSLVVEFRQLNKKAETLRVAPSNTEMCKHARFASSAPRRVLAAAHGPPRVAASSFSSLLGKMAVFSVLKAFLYGVFLGILWECASMSVLLGATLVEHLMGTVFMTISFVGLAVLAYSIASRADLARPLFSILAFRLTAQLAMTLGTGSVLLATMLHDTPQCATDRLRKTGWRAPALRVARRVLPSAWLRRIFGVEPPFGPPFLRVLAAALSNEWLGWLPSFGGWLPSLVSLPGTITFKPGGSGGLPAGVSAVDDAGLASSWLSSGQELAGVYTYVCQDTRHGDFHYLFRYHAFWMRPAAMALLHALGSLLVKMLLMHAYAALFMLLAQANCRDAWVAELRRRADRFRRLVWPRPPVRLIAVEPGDLCAFCHEELLQAAPGDSSPATGPDAVHHRSCRWGCGKAVHTACAANWGRNACVYCSAPMS